MTTLLELIAGASIPLAILLTIAAIDEQRVDQLLSRHNHPTSYANRNDD